MMDRYVLMPRTAVDMGIYFRRRDAFMSQHILDAPQIRTVLDQMGRERMAERVGRYDLPHTGQQSQTLHCLEH